MTMMNMTSRRRRCLFIVRLKWYANKNQSLLGDGPRELRVSSVALLEARTPPSVPAEKAFLCTVSEGENGVSFGIFLCEPYKAAPLPSRCLSHSLIGCSTGQLSRDVSGCQGSQVGSPGENVFFFLFLSFLVTLFRSWWLRLGVLSVYS